jgi:hypothetical protein
MARSIGASDTGAFRENLEHANFVSPGGSAQYRVSRDANGLLLDFSQGNIEGRRRLDYYIGSGAIGRSYLSAIDGFLFQAPVSYYSSTTRWGLAPGPDYQGSENVNLIRAVEPGCLNCHASRVQPVAGTVNGYARQPFLEGGISCERCHGPGEEHVARMKSGKRTGGLGIVNPSKLDAARRDSVCAQCHLVGVVQIAKNGTEGAFHPGELLSDFVAVFVWSGVSGEMTVNGHDEQLGWSLCRRASKGKLWCGTCHDPHRVPAQSDKAAFYRNRCLTCHTDSSCAATRQARAQAQDNCITCHMPSAPVRAEKFIAFTDHSIARTPRVDAGTTVAADRVLVPFGDAPAGNREFGLAYAKIGLLENNNVWGMRAFELLKKVNAEHPEDVKVASELAQLYDRMGDEEKACNIFARIVASDKTDIRAALTLGVCLAKEGKIQESIRLWQGVLARDPALESARFNLAVAQFREGDAAAARTTLNEGLKFNPASRRAREFLSEFARGAQN